jgi:hypothetical protein
LVEGDLAIRVCEIADTVSTTSSWTYWVYLHREPTNFVRKVEVLMGALKMFPIATNRATSSGPCAKLILEAEIECGAFTSATNRLFGKEVARTAVALWVEELEACPKHFRGSDSLWRIVTISSASRLADLMGATRSTEKTHHGGTSSSALERPT